ncbi:uncharacterized protein KY384_005270 [Bacidia gigantensis]|uniref:uncharacterized protein n=1 Tax=Bacidia gigantensis TaxID=2732470 RepID=UPI001D056A8C|nr:uncharacterized protein KY384_005270 [Bacidia gigantensis]KAG8529789.1 hypothetical protein KY384_005270 [Bacidia gigantensis]
MALKPLLLFLSTIHFLDAAALPGSAGKTEQVNPGFAFDQVIGTFSNPNCSGDPVGGWDAGTYAPNTLSAVPTCLDATKFSGEFIGINWGSKKGEDGGAQQMRSLGLFKDKDCKQDAGWYALRPTTWPLGESEARACFAVDEFGGPYGGFLFWGALVLKDGETNSFPSVPGAVS